MKEVLVRVAAMALVLAPLGAAAFDQAEADDLCTRAARNHRIFELFSLTNQVARPGPVAGGFSCSWEFTSASSTVGLVVTLEMQPVKSLTAARQAIMLALLPENRGGKKVEALSGMGDAAVQRTTVKDQIVQQIEIETVQGRRRFLFAATPRSEVASYRLSGQCFNFLASGLSRLRE